jgi:hypothetical protein
MITRKIDNLILWKKQNNNQVPKSINADGSIYNNGLGYKDGYRVRSGGAEGANSNTTCTGFIKVNPGDVIRIAGFDFSHPQNGNAINLSDNSFTNIGQFTMLPAGYGIIASSYSSYGHTSVVKESNNVHKWIVPPAASGVAYIRISGYSTSGYPSSKLIVTINEEIY